MTLQETSLPAGKYDISVNQRVTAQPGKPGDANAAPAKKLFETVAPEWALSASNIISAFPTPGDTAPSFRTLPHVVIRDSELPWARIAGQKVPGDHGDEIPWLALVIFTADELTLDEDHRNSYFEGRNINDTLGWDMPVGKISSILDKSPEKKDRLANFIPQPNQEDVDKEVKTSLIAVPSQVFKKLFTNMESGNEFDVSPYRFMAHVRNVTATGTVSAAITNNDPNAKTNGSDTFSVVVSHRLGPTHVTAPTPVLAHIVSLQGIDTKPVSVLDGKEHVLMTSLFSWSYTALPPSTPDADSMLRYLGNSNQGLRLLRSDLFSQGATAGTGHEKMITDVVARLQMNGYTLIRYRTASGEETAAMLRGPLTPTKVPHPLRKDGIFQVNVGTDLHILDSDLGIMDISNGSAWQLGKTLALEDSSFITAIARLRTKIHSDGPGTARKVVSKELERWKAAISTLSDADTRSTQMAQNVQYTADERANTPGGGAHNYHDVSNDPDYAIVQKWVFDKLLLADIPAHYLLPEPSFLPAESLRCFHIDENWTDAIVDGALSLGNHFCAKPEEDFARSSLKNALNHSLKTPVIGSDKQQIPTYGFLLRSQLLVRFPDFALSLDFEKNNAKSAAPILVQRRLAEDMMLVLLDKEPSNLSKLTLTLPAHQQQFMVPFQFDEKTDDVEVHYKRVYATGADEQLLVDQERLGVPRPECKFSRSSIFDWEARTLKIQEYANLVHDNLKKYMPDGQYQKEMPTSAAIALQLSEPTYTLVMPIT